MEKNIFIIGNGFDLAHGYKTDYSSFIKWLVDKYIENGVFVNELFVISNYNDGTQGLKGYVGIVSNSLKETLTTEKFKVVWLEVKSELAKLILKDLNAKKWCDIEVLYYYLLKKTDSPDILNKDLDFLKDELEQYLKEVKYEKWNIELSSFFNRISPKHKNLVLNFNYTNTFERWYSKNGECEIVNIHGQLDCKLNPMIFGYASTEEETQILIDKNDNEYLKNIKKYYYKQTHGENKLYNFLGKKPGGGKINVFVIGHSCGVSDRKILKDIFTHPNIKNINIVYYKNYDNYFDTLVNIDRIIGEESNYATIRNFELSLACPQIKDTFKVKEEFNNTLENVKKNIFDTKGGSDARF